MKALALLLALGQVAGCDYAEERCQKAGGNWRPINCETKPAIPALGYAAETNCEMACVFIERPRSPRVTKAEASGLNSE
jgi:hypothetical protein